MVGYLVGVLVGVLVGYWVGVLVGDLVGALVGSGVQCCESALATPSASVGGVTVGQVGTVHVVVFSSAQMTS